PIIDPRTCVATSIGEGYFQSAINNTPFEQMVWEYPNCTGRSVPISGNHGIDSGMLDQYIGFSARARSSVSYYGRNL
ncbi:MAG: hypothetical protein ACREP9_00300, partial [Candidatus Dormibacteraceae bacterium]